MTKLKISFIREHQDNPPGVMIRAVPEFVTDTFIPNVELRDVTTPYYMQELVTEAAKRQILNILYGDAKNILQQIMDYLDAAPFHTERIFPSELPARLKAAIDSFENMERNVEVKYGSRETLQSLGDEVQRLRQDNNRLSAICLDNRESCREALRKLSNRRSRGLKALCHKIMGE